MINLCPLLLRQISLWRGIDSLIPGSRFNVKHFYLYLKKNLTQEVSLKLVFQKDPVMRNRDDEELPATLALPLHTIMAKAEETIVFDYIVTGNSITYSAFTFDFKE